MSNPEKRAQDLTEIIMTDGQWFLHKFLQIVVIIVPMFLVVIITSKIEFMTAADAGINLGIYFMLFFIIRTIIKAINKNRTIIEMIVGVRLVHINSGRPVSFKEYDDSIDSDIAVELKYTDAYQAFYELNSSTNQSLKMKRLGWVYVREKLYKEFKDKYHY